MQNPLLLTPCTAPKTPKSSTGFQIYVSVVARKWGGFEEAQSRTWRLSKRSQFCKCHKQRHHILNEGLIITQGSNHRLMSTASETPMSADSVIETSSLLIPCHKIQFSATETHLWCFDRRPSANRPTCSSSPVSLFSNSSPAIRLRSYAPRRPESCSNSLAASSALGEALHGYTRHWTPATASPTYKRSVHEYREEAYGLLGQNLLEQR